MCISELYEKISKWQEKHTPFFNTIANHLLVVFTFFVPLSFSGRSSTLFILMLVFLLRGNYLYYIKEAPKDKIVLAFLLYFAVHIIWLIGTENFVYAKRIVNEAKFLLHPLLFVTFIDRKFIPRLLATFFVAMVISELWSYGIFFEILPPSIHDGGQGTATDPTPVLHHIHYGFILAITLALILQRYFYERDSWYIKAAMIFFFITASANLFITAGRTGYILYIIVMVFILFRLFRSQLLKAIPVAVLIIGSALVIAYNFSATFKVRVEQTVNSIEAVLEDKNFKSSIGYRMAVIIYSDKVIEDHWLLGVGTGDHMDVVRESISENYPEIAPIANDIHHMHNEYITALIQFGVIGLLAFLNILYQIARYEQPDVQLKNMQLVLIVAVFFFGIPNVLVAGNAALFIFTTLISFTFRRYFIDNAEIIKINIPQVAKYGAAIAAIEMVSWVT